MALRKRVWFNTPYHNYNDRRKYLLDSSEYNDYKLYEETNTAWNHGDFINSSCVTVCPINVFTTQPNYLIIMKDGVAESRWFVTGFQFISGEPDEAKSKFQVSLLRDVIVDYRTNIASGFGKIHRGNLSVNQWSPILVQPEGLMLNQVKVDQKDIKSWDEDTKWLTIFYDYTANSDDRKLAFDRTLFELTEYDKTTIQTDFSSRGFTFGGKNYYKRSWDWMSVSGTSVGNMWSGWDNVPFEVIITPSRIEVYLHTLTVGALKYTTSDSSLITLLDTHYNYDYTDKYAQLTNKYQNVTYDDDGTLYELSFEGPERYFEFEYTNAIGEDLNVMIRSILNRMPYFKNSTNTYIHNPEVYSTTIVELTNKAIPIITQSSGELLLPGKRLDELNLGCITIPYGNQVSLKDDTTIYNITDLEINNLATSGFTNTGTVIKDIQILPYCPSQVLNSTLSNSTPSNTIEMTDIDNWFRVPIKDNLDNTIYYGFVCSTSSLENIVPFDYTVDINLKQESMTKFVRIRAHNHKSSFEFSPVMNGPTGVEWLKIQCTLRPFNTVYRIVPVFDTQGLYGGDYTDDRGLIWEGGFSLSQITDAWIEYKLQNSTYQDVFNREMQNLEVTRENARALETLNYETAYSNARSNIRASAGKGIVNHVGGMAQAGLSAYMGDYGAAASQGISATTNVINAAISVRAASNIAARNLAAGKEAQGINDAKHVENLSYKSDLFTLTNQAIQARPSNLVSNSDYSIINNYKAYIEIYDCTEQEKLYVTNYLTFRAMKIDQIGSISTYLKNDMDYIEANLLFMTGLTPVVTNQINAELTAGIYVQGGLLDE